MLYKAKINWYNEITDKEQFVGLLIPGETITEVANTIAIDFENDKVISVEITQFAPDDYVTIWDEALFDYTTEKIEKEIIW